MAGNDSATPTTTTAKESIASMFAQHHTATVAAIAAYAAYAAVRATDYARRAHGFANYAIAMDGA